MFGLVAVGCLHSIRGRKQEKLEETDGVLTTGPWEKRRFFPDICTFLDSHSPLKQNMIGGLGPNTPPQYMEQEHQRCISSTLFLNI